MGATAAVAIGGAAGLAGGASKFFEGRRMQKKAEKAIENFKWQELKNPYKDLQVSTLGADLQREEAARTLATSVDAIRGGGSRAIVGGLARAQQQQNLVSRQVAAGLDEQQKQIDYAGAQDDTRIRDMVEQRQSSELQGYGQMMNVGMGMKYGGISDITNTAFAASQFGQQPTKDTTTPPIKKNTSYMRNDYRNPNTGGRPLIDFNS
jgi:hypothetical protein